MAFLSHPARLLPFVLLAIFITACVPPPDTARPGMPPAAPSPSLVPPAGPRTLDKLYDYSKVKAYSYISTTFNAKGEPSLIIFSHEVSKESVNGVPAYRIAVQMTMPSAPMPNGTSGTSVLWFDAATDKCLDGETIIIVNGVRSEGTKPSCGHSTTYGNPPGQSLFPYIGEETITVPAGTFKTEKFGIPGAIVYYMAKGVPVPIKSEWSSRNATSGMFYELQSLS